MEEVKPAVDERMILQTGSQKIGVRGIAYELAQVKGQDRIALQAELANGDFLYLQVNGIEPGTYVIGIGAELRLGKAYSDADFATNGQVTILENLDGKLSGTLAFSLGTEKPVAYEGIFSEVIPFPGN